MKKNILLILLVLFAVTGCSSVSEKKNVQALKEAEKGNYVKAAILLNEAVALEPTYAEGTTNYINVYPMAVKKAKASLTLCETNHNYMEEVKSYENMISLKDGLYNLDPIVVEKLSIILDIPEYLEVEELKKDAGKSYYNAGNTLENKILDRYGKRKKYFLYSRGDELNPDYLDIDKRANTSFEDAKILVAFCDVVDNTHNKASKKVEGIAIPQIRSELLQDTKLKKLLIYKETPKQRLKEYLSKVGNMSKKELKDVNTIIKINITNFSYEPTKTFSKKRDVVWKEKYIDIVDGIEVVKYKENSYREVFYEKSNSANLLISYEMIDAEKGIVIGKGSFSSKKGDYYSWKKYTRGKVPKDYEDGIEKNITDIDTLITKVILEVSSKLGKSIRKTI